MGSLLREIFNHGELLPQGSIFLRALHASSDVLIGLACAVISFTIYRLWRRARVRANPLVLGLAAFVMATALTHLMDAWAYAGHAKMVGGWVKAFAALLAAALAILLIRMRPRIEDLARITKMSEGQRSKLEEQQAFLNAVLEGLSETIVACDAEGRITLVNRAGKELHGKMLESARFEEWPERYHLYEADGQTPMYWRNVPLYRALNGATLRNVEMTVKPPGKPPRVVCVVKAQPLYNRSRKKIGAVAAMTDITEKARLLEEKDRIAESAERLTVERQVKQQFISALTHDLRNPLSAAKSSAIILRRHSDRADQRERLLNRIERSLERADHMLSDLLDATLVESGGRITVDIRFTDLAGVARDTVEELSAIYGDRFILDCPEQVKGYWSAEGLRRVIENLASNAVKYGHDRRDITVRMEQDTDQLSVTVQNFGDPIPAEERELLFQAFHRRNEAVQSGRKGWGIGLTVVKGVVEAHGGRVDVQSDDATGTSFIVKLPNDARSHQVHEESPGPGLRRQEGAPPAGERKEGRE